MSVLQATLASALVAGTPLLFAALGELLAEKVGVLNIGIEGIMLVGAAGGFIASIETGNLVLGLLGGAVSGAIFTFVLFTLPVLFLSASQVLVGFALWFAGIGLSAEIANSYTNRPLEFETGKTSIPLLADIPWIGEILFEQPWPVYLGVVLAGAVALLLVRTRHGLNMRAIGQDPVSAHAMGVPVRFWQAFYSIVGGAFAGVGGALLSIIITEGWKAEMTSGRGWVALALVVFAAWKPIRLIAMSYLFGLLLILSHVGQAEGWAIPSPFLAMMPYVMTVAVLILRTWRERSKAEGSLAPTALGVTFVRGQR